MGLRRAVPLALLLRSVGCVKRRARALAVRGGREAPSHTAHLNYQEPHPELATGRYIDQEDQGDVVDTVEPRPVEMRDARQLDEPATLERMGFCLEEHPTAVRDFRDDTAVGEVYYEEVRELVKRASGASRVFVFDHTVDSEQNELERGADATPRHLDAVDVAVRELAPRSSVPHRSVRRASKT